MFDQLWKKVVAVSVLIGGAMGFLGAIAGIAGWLKLEPESLASLVVAPFLFLLNWLISEHTIPGWLIILFGFFGLFTGRKLILHFRRARPKSYKYLRFVEGEVLGVSCAWRWYRGEPTDLKWLCPVCKAQLEQVGTSFYDAVPLAALFCRQCNRTIKKLDCNEHQIEEYFSNEIERLARTQYDLPLHHD